MRYYDWYKNLSWCAMVDDSVKQGSLCQTLTLTKWVRILVGYYFFILFWFIVFCYNDQTRYFPFFSTFAFVFLLALVFSQQRSFTSLNFFIESQKLTYRNSCQARNIVATLLIVLNVSIILNYLKTSSTCHTMINRYWKCSTQIFISMIK